MLYVVMVRFMLLHGPLLAAAAVVATAAASVHAVENDQHQLPPVLLRIGVNCFDCFV